MSYDNEGRFRPQQFEDLFAKYDRDAKGGLAITDLWSLWNGQKLVFDFFGWTATALECKLYPALRPTKDADRVLPWQGPPYTSYYGPMMESYERKMFDRSSTAASSTGRPKNMPQSRKYSEIRS